MKAQIGNHLKMNAHPSNRKKIKDFYVTLLGCEFLKSPIPALDLFKFEGGCILGVYYTDDKQLLSEKEYLNTTWLELHITNPDELKKRLIDFGVKKVDYPDPDHFYFQAPGGQVYRLASHTIT